MASGGRKAPVTFERLDRAATSMFRRSQRLLLVRRNDRLMPAARLDGESNFGTETAFCRQRPPWRSVRRNRSRFATVDKLQVRTSEPEMYAPLVLSDVVRTFPTSMYAPPSKCTHLR
jgi:hypothetical protein